VKQTGELKTSASNLLIMKYAGQLRSQVPIIQKNLHFGFDKNDRYCPAVDLCNTRSIRHYKVHSDKWAV